MTERQQKYQAQYEEGLIGMLVSEYMDVLGEGLLAEAEAARQDPALAPSEQDRARFLKAMDRHYRKQEISAWLKAGRQALKIAGIVICILSVAFAVSYVTVEAFRIRANNFFIETHSRYTELLPQEPGGIDLSDYDEEVVKALPTYLPEGFELTRLDNEGTYITAEYRFGDQLIVYGRYSVEETGNPRVDTEDMDYADYIEVNGCRAFLVEKDKKISLNWYSTKYRFSLKGHMSREESVTIAESVNIL